MSVGIPVFSERQKALRVAMQRDGLSATVVFGLSSYTGPGSMTHGYIRYLTGWSSRFAASMLVQPVGGLPTLIVSNAHDVMYITESFPWVERGLSEPPQNYGKVARELLRRMAAERVGLVGQSEMPQSLYRDLVDGEPTPLFVSADHLLDALRLVKDDREIENHRQAARISDQMLNALFERMPHHRGPVWKLMVEMEYAGRSLGAELATGWLVAGQPADRPRYRLEENEREVRDGDQVLVGVYVTYRGYWAHCLRMGSVGAPSQDYRRIYDASLGQHRAAVAQIRPGSDASNIQTKAELFADEVLPGSLGYAARFRYGHFLGLDYAEVPTSLAFPQPDSWSQSPRPAVEEVVLRPGMLLEVHTNLGLNGVGFGSIGDVYLVREDGPERLTAFPQDLVIV